MKGKVFAVIGAAVAAIGTLAFIFIKKKEA